METVGHPPVQSTRNHLHFLQGLNLFVLGGKVNYYQRSVTRTGV